MKNLKILIGCLVCFSILLGCMSREEMEKQAREKRTADSLAQVARQQAKAAAFAKTLAEVKAYKAGIKMTPIKIDSSLKGATVSTNRNILLIVDDSGSMSETPDGDCGDSKRFSSKMEGAIAAVINFIDKAPKDDRIGVCNINGAVVAPLGTNRDELRRLVKEMSPMRNTPLGGAIIEATKILAKQCQMQLGYGEYRIIAFTDGRATDNRVPEGVTYATKHGIPVYAIGLCVPEDIEIRYWADWYKTVSLDGLSEALEETLGEAVD